MRLEEMSNPAARPLQSGLPAAIFENRIPLEERDLMSGTR
jgi:hypothetical protein